MGGNVGAGRNVISGNRRNGVLINAPGATANRVRNNLIGTDATGIQPLGNGENGVCLDGGASGNGIGDRGVARNIIAFNSANGVLVKSGRANFLRQNAIFANSGLGINLGPDGVTSNDPGDADAGPNDLQNYPILTSALIGTGLGLSISGELSSQSNTTYTLEFFSSSECDSSGFGEGAEFVGTATLTTDATGTAGFNLSFSNSVAVGRFITATATDRAGNSSEFSACVQAVPVSPLLLSLARRGGVLTISWLPELEHEFVLETTTSLSPPVHWTPTTNQISSVGQLRVVSLDTATGQRFFRLAR